MTLDGWSAGILAAMYPSFPPLWLLLVIFARWVNRHQLDVIEYLQEENRVFKEHLGGGRIRLTDTERRRLARRAHTLGRKVFNELRTLVTPDTPALLESGSQSHQGGEAAFDILPIATGELLELTQRDPYEGW
jgi:hypothetical protein